MAAVLFRGSESFNTRGPTQYWIFSWQILDFPKTLGLCANASTKRLKRVGRALSFAKMGKPTQATTTQTQQERTGLIFPFSRVKNKLKAKKTWKQISPEAPIFLTAVAEYIATTVIRHACVNIVNEKQEEKQNYNLAPHARVNMSDIVTAVREDVDYARLFSGFAFSSGTNAPKASKVIGPPKKATKPTAVAAGQ